MPPSSPCEDSTNNVAAKEPPTALRLDHEIQIPLQGDAESETDLSVDKVSRMMLEQDADLLESMHYAASQVSQYSPGGTPLMRPKDRSLPMEDVPLMLMPLTSTSQLLLSSELPPPLETRTASFSSATERLGPRSRATSDSSRSVQGGSLSGGVFSILQPQQPQQLLQQQSQDKLSDCPPYRRLLSGEVRTTDGDGKDQCNVEEEETTASPVSVAQEATTTIIKTEKESGLAEQRRKRDSMLFAEAVGENVGMKDELCIIEDHSHDGEGVESDDDEACESKEIRIDDGASIAETIHSYHTNRRDQSHGGPDDSMSFPTHVDIISRTPIQKGRKTKRPLWPFGNAGPDMSFLDNLSNGGEQNNFVYKGICANPPEITKRGMQRGNYAQLHRKAWLEVSDKYHRYGKNLRLYYRYWERLGFPTNQFFDWLDSKGEAAGQPLPNLEECPRSILDSDTVLYITNPEVTDGYALDIYPREDGRGRIIDVDGDPVYTGPDGWIFVLRDNIIYAAEKITSISGQSKQRFHHSSFFGGKAVVAAGIIITDEDGILKRLYPHSGHYRPGEAHMQRMLYYLHSKGVDLRTFQVDIQQFRHVSRDKDGKQKEGKSKEKDGKSKEGKPSKDKDGEKKLKKVDSLHLEKAVFVACFLYHKARFIGQGIFSKIHKIRKADVTSVTEALLLVDEGGFWKRGKNSNNNDLSSGDN